ncbi:recombinase family protein [Erwiniaceae bacterium L1_54_6]|nr:recombinase family protein [Erwiniaceae bacterium L1_54_6]
MLIGYVRVSTNDQNTDLHRVALQSADCELILEDKISGTKADRPGLRRVIKTLKAGDTLVVWKLDRLGRSMRNLVMLIEELKEKGINFRSLTDSIDTGMPMGRFFVHIMGALAEMKRELIVERTTAGLAAARAKGRIGGRQRIMTPEVVERARRMIANGATLNQVAMVLELSSQTVYRYIPAAEQQGLRNQEKRHLNAGSDT